MKRISFVSCVKTKSMTSELAEHLYISPWFRMARDWARRNSERWFILSAEHGLLSPSTLVDPYETTLNRMGIKDRKRWASRVEGQMDELGLRGDRAFVLAGERYREFLLTQLHSRFENVKVPMRGLQMGEQLSWMKKELGVHQ